MSVEQLPTDPPKFVGIDQEPRWLTDQKVWASEQATGRLEAGLPTPEANQAVRDGERPLDWLVETSALRFASEIEEEEREFQAQPEYIRQMLYDWQHLGDEEKYWLRKFSQGLADAAERFAERRQSSVVTMHPSGRVRALHWRCDWKPLGKD